MKDIAFAQQSQNAELLERFLGANGLQPRDIKFHALFLPVPYQRSECLCTAEVQFHNTAGLKDDRAHRLRCAVNGIVQGLAEWFCVEKEERCLKPYHDDTGVCLTDEIGTGGPPDG